MLTLFLVSLAVLALLSIITKELTHINNPPFFLDCVAWIALLIDAAVLQRGLCPDYLVCPTDTLREGANKSSHRSGL
ncbi:MAG: hypothetical protein LPH21_06940 [Shewanella sp.]|nr:hypothetical protein [Shewanella sp.]